MVIGQGTQTDTLCFQSGSFPSYTYAKCSSRRLLPKEACRLTIRPFWPKTPHVPHVYSRRVFPFFCGSTLRLLYHARSIIERCGMITICAYQCCTALRCTAQTAADNRPRTIHPSRLLASQRVCHTATCPIDSTLCNYGVYEYRQSHPSDCT